MRQLVIVVIMLLAASCPAAERTWVGLVTPAQLETARAALKAGDPIVTKAWQDLLRRADRALQHEPGAVATFDVPGYYGKEKERHIRMKNLLSADAAAAYVCALAAAIGHGLPDDKAAAFRAKAIAIVDAWAGTNAKISGADGSLVMCYNGTALVTAAFLLRGRPGWTEAHGERMDAWVENVLRRAARIKGRKNNWAGWGIFAAVSADAWLADEAALAADADRLAAIIDQQIEPDGSMPHEIKRGKRGIWYTYFALAPMTAACEVLRNNGGADLYRLDPPTKGTIRDAVAFFFAHGVEDQSTWPKAGVTDRVSPSGRDGILMYAMGCVYGEKSWRDFARHPTWRGSTGLAWMTPSLVPPAASPEP